MVERASEYPHMTFTAGDSNDWRLGAVLKLNFVKLTHYHFCMYSIQNLSIVVPFFNLPSYSRGKKSFSFYSSVTSITEIRYDKFHKLIAQDSLIKSVGRTRAYFISFSSNILF